MTRRAAAFLITWLASVSAAFLAAGALADPIAAGATADPVVARAAPRAIAAGAVASPAAAADPSTASVPPAAVPGFPTRAVLPAWMLSAAGDDRGLRLGFDGTLRFSSLRREREPSGAVATSRPAPSGAGLQFGAMQSLGSDPENSTYASLRGRFELPGAGSWLGVGSRIAAAGTPVRAHVDLGAGWEPHLRSIQVEFAAFMSSVSTPPGTMRPIVHLGADSTYLGDPVPTPSHDAIWTTGQTTLRWIRGRTEIATVGGITVGRFTAPQRWAQAQVRYRLSPQWTLSMAAGRAAPAALAFDPRSSPHTQVGLEFSPSGRIAAGIAAVFPPVARRWSAVSLHDGRVALHVECPHARRLEVRGDFTEWEPVEMRSIGGNWWELVAAAEPGLHRVQLRIDDGSWSAPPGLPLGAAGEQGPAGTLLIQ